MTTLQWSQVHAWRMSQHGLSPRFSSHDVALAVTRTAGIQAQVASAAELAMCTRVEGLSPRDVQAAIFQDHTLVKTWAMRGTLHLLAARELPLYVAARDWQHNASWSNYFAEFGLSRAQQDTFLFATESLDWGVAAHRATAGASGTGPPVSAGVWPGDRRRF
ncbi:MAG: winged helix DNA-binding domain-containing protein [Chloroflexi bacterium]|nr:MAG: winged helix DNA-binding domain-containing protein [Chloroflexota bacterium]